MAKGKRNSNRPSAGGIIRNDYHRRNRKENNGHRWIGGYSGNKGVAEFERLSTAPILVPEFAREDLEDRARRHFNKRRHDAEFISGTTVERMCVDYLRHRLSKYDSARVRVYGAAYLTLFRKLIDTIAALYPWLAQECERQYLRHANQLQHNDIRLVKRPATLTQTHAAELNQREAGAFVGMSETYESPGYLGEVDIDEDAKDPRSSSLDPDMMIFFPPFLKKEVASHRFASDPEKMNDRWWEWEEEREMVIKKREHPRRLGTN